MQSTGTLVMFVGIVLAIGAQIVGAAIVFTRAFLKAFTTPR